MIIVHHLNNSRSQRILWLLEELGLDYEVKYYQRNPGMLAPEGLKAVHPLGKSPVITDGNKTIAESGAIVDYIIENYGNGRLIPAPGTPERLRYNYWLHYAEGSAMPPLVMKLIFSSIPDSPQMPWLLRPVARGITNAVLKSYIGPQVDSHIAFWATALEGSAWFAGDELTGADIMMSFPVEAAAARAVLPAKLLAFLETIHARPAYQKALQRGGPYELMS